MLQPPSRIVDAKIIKRTTFDVHRIFIPGKWDPIRLCPERKEHSQKSGITKSDSDHDHFFHVRPEV
jgi:hypothetical protein